MRIIFIILFVLPMALLAQKSGRYVSKGLLTGKGTLALGKPTSFAGTNAYISGNLQYYVSDNVSYRGGLWMFMGSTDEKSNLSKNHSLFTGLYYHPSTKTGIDPYVGFEPGLSWTQLKLPEEGGEDLEQLSQSAYPNKISPVVSATAGINYFASEITHLFFEAKYVYGNHLSDLPVLSLSEIRLAFGFGWNLRLLKAK